MSALKPEDCDALMYQAITARDLEAAVSLYETDASFVLDDGHVAVGHDAIREVLRPFMTVEDFKFTKQPVAFISAQNDLALLRGTWSATRIGEGGGREAIGGNNIEIVRRQSDGSWKFVVDHPSGAD